MYAVYKLVQVFLYPEIWISICLLGAWGLSRSPDWLRISRRLLGLAILLFVGLSIRPTTELLLRPLESQYWSAPTDDDQHYDAIVVLGGGYKFHPQTGNATVLQTQGLDRLVCGLLALRNGVAPTLLLSGGPRGLIKMAPSSDAEAMRDLALQLGASPSAIQIESSSLNTAEEATEIKKMLPNGARILLVTSALHLPRSVALFRHQGFNVIPMPCDYVTESTMWGLESFFPSAIRLEWARAAIHEYVGLAVLWLMGRL